MAENAITLRAKAKVAGIEGYKLMTVPELEAALKKSGGSTGRKAAPAASSNGSGRKQATGRKVASTTVKKPAASTGRKQATSAKQAPAAKSETSGKAKRPATGTRKQAAATTKKAPATTKKQAAPKAAKVNADAPGRAAIDNKAVDWKKDTTIGKADGPRQDIMRALRKFNGNKEKVFTALKDAAQTLYPRNKRSGERYNKAKSLELLRWHIGRVAFDYVVQTGQHTVSSNRAAYGHSTDPQAVKRREARGVSSTGTTGRKSAPKAQTARKPAPTPKKAQTPARKPAAASTPKSAAGRKTAAARKR
jgi:hypothetical protein